MEHFLGYFDPHIMAYLNTFTFLVLKAQVFLYLKK